jgi:hypothetical protein
VNYHIQQLSIYCLLQLRPVGGVIILMYSYCLLQLVPVGDASIAFTVQRSGKRTILHCGSDFRGEREPFYLSGSEPSFSEQIVLGLFWDRLERQLLRLPWWVCEL